MKTPYYFVATALPPLLPGVEPEITWQEIKVLLEDNLTKKDHHHFRVFLQYYDLLNIRSYWQNLPLGFLGNWDAQEIETHLIDQEDLDSYLIEYLEEKSTTEERVQNFKYLLMHYFFSSKPKGFLGWFLSFEGGIQLNLTVMRALDLNRSLKEEIPEDWGLQEAVLDVTRDGVFVPPEPYTRLKELYEQEKSNPLALDQALDQFRLEAVREQVEYDYFSIDCILAYVVTFLTYQKKIVAHQESKKFVESIMKGMEDE